MKGQGGLIAKRTILGDFKNPNCPEKTGIDNVVEQDIWNSFFTKEEFLTLISGTLIPIVSMFFTFFISKAIIHLFKLPKNHHGTFSTMFTCSNTIFIGLPINLAIFGEKAVPYVLLY